MLTQSHSLDVGAKSDNIGLCIVYFSYCITEINNTQANNVKDIDVVMPFCNLQDISKTIQKTLDSKVLFKFQL